ncbi:transmembrane protein 208 homolog [Carica papaya]|uniref:transmembrane protein 208 homolog n=1 Tax=Carica papaya TaxID=3649 RepID=UPI000B8CA2AE|nr:transmembrane protein 208 homolog [Carica papaya]XP_021901717.1 transmembrane protein 208 homolog [Carica papaya]XP_021901727.1 transmembrane protein 208 homolog [Carica papaya]XP_021901735.1 transmembrane protein 208 homolog [Carica papaya]
MANQGAKKQKEKNVRHMTNLRHLIIACNVVYVLVRILILHSSFTWKHWVGLVLTSLAYAIPYKQLDQMAKPTYASDGELIDGGFDMSTGGICGYAFSVLLDSFCLYFSMCNMSFS